MISLDNAALNRCAQIDNVGPRFPGDVIDCSRCQTDPSRINRMRRTRKKRSLSWMPRAFYRPMTSSLVIILCYWDGMKRFRS
uniref:Uncharacterized protein n=1 Tax=Onchocerca volvulus TaxID=6282 RepID=A0A8R1XQF3_ONCVO